ncbi:MAG: hypothetical protein WD055_05140 [Candidatus Dependentiae bacterium]
MKYTIISLFLLSSTFIKTADSAPDKPRSLSKWSTSQSSLPNTTISNETEKKLSRTQSRITLASRRGHRRTPSKSFTEGTAPQITAQMQKIADEPLLQTKTIKTESLPEWTNLLKMMPHVLATAQKHYSEMPQKEQEALAIVAHVVQTEENLQKIKTFLSFSDEITDQLLNLGSNPEECELLAQHERNPDLKKITSILDESPTKCAVLLKILQTISEDYLLYLANHTHLSADAKDIDPAMQHKCFELMRKLYEHDIKPLQEAHKKAHEETQELAFSALGYTQLVDTADTQKWLGQMPIVIRQQNEILKQLNQEKKEVNEKTEELLPQIMRLQRQQEQIFELLKKQVEGRATMELQIQMIAHQIQAYREHEDEIKNPDSSSSRKRRNSRGSKTKHFFSGPLSPRSSKDKIERTSKS